MFDIRLLEVPYNTSYVAHIVSNPNVSSMEMVFNGFPSRFFLKSHTQNHLKKTKKPTCKKPKHQAKQIEENIPVLEIGEGKMGVLSKEIQAMSHKCCIKSTWCFMKATAFLMFHASNSSFFPVNNFFSCDILNFASFSYKTVASYSDLWRATER